ncbi:MAG TPA: secretin N-terminal domain-containing protein [Verrucomicrobiae bacterium]|jgi:general secretion pathway protein D|nr:secretin N-terminal domain-containing protein [Verrucomicrobiae bacterium]
MKKTIHSAKKFLALFLATFMVVASGHAQRMRGMPMMPGSPMPPPDSGPSHSDSSGSGQKNDGAWIPSEPLGGGPVGTNGIQLSLENANIDMVVQWLAQTTGKTVIKSPTVQCQLTIASPKKVTERQAINLVYSALALQGFTVVENSQSILIVPKGEQLNMSPEVITGPQSTIPEGRERLMKVFPLKHVQAATLVDKIRPALTDSATVQVDDADNELIISDFNDNLRVAGDLIAALDANRPEDVTIRVIPLTHMSAQDLAKELSPIYQKMVGNNSQETIDVAADDRSNSLLILSSASTFAALKDIVSMLDTEGAQEKEIKTFVLKNADAQDVATQLQTLTQGQKNNNDYPFFFFSEGSSQSNPKGVNIVADRRRNAVIVQAPPAQLNSIASIIDDLDAPVTDSNLAPLIYHLKYANASDVQDVLNALFVKQQASRSYYDYFFGNSSQNDNQSAGRLYGKVRIASEPFSNTIIVSADSQEDLQALENVIHQLDEPSEAGESTLHVGLKFARSANVANDFNILFAEQGSPPLRPETPDNQQTANNNNNSQNQQQAGASTLENSFNLAAESAVQPYYPWLGGQSDNQYGGFGGGNRKTAVTVSDLVGRVRTVADEGNNAVIISANLHFFPEILKLLTQMDAPTEQVSIEARIVEVSSDYLKQLGVQFSPNGSVFTANDYDNSALISVGGTYQKGFGGNTLVNSPPNPFTSVPSGSTVPSLTQTLTELRSGVLDNNISMDFLIQFLHKTTDATVLGDPQITVNNNVMGRLFVGNEVPVPQSSVFSSVGSQNTSIVYKDVGIVLEVTPHINDAGDIQLAVHAESSSIVPGQTVLGGAVFSTRNFRTDLTAKTGQTLVMGGIIQRMQNNTLRKTPILGDIPILKLLVNKKNSEDQNDELLVFLHPRVLKTPADAKKLLRGINQRNPEMEKWEGDQIPAQN